MKVSVIQPYYSFDPKDTDKCYNCKNINEECFECANDRLTKIFNKISEVEDVENN